MTKITVEYQPTIALQQGAPCPSDQCVFVCVCQQQFSADISSKASSVCLAHLFTYQDFDEGTLGLAYVAPSKPDIAGGLCSTGAEDSLPLLLLLLLLLILLLLLHLRLLCLLLLLLVLHFLLLSTLLLPLLSSSSSSSSSCCCTFTCHHKLSF